MLVKIFSTLARMEMKDWIRAARQSATLTQDQLAERLGLTKGNISAWENGRHEASHEQLVRVAAITGYKEPLPGMSQSLPPPSSDWPFQAISQRKISVLNPTQAAQLEGAILLAAAQLGLDVKKS